jgi:hypothetical protein
MDFSALFIPKVIFSVGVVNYLASYVLVIQPFVTYNLACDFLIVKVFH